MGGYKAWHDIIHDHQVESFASENGLTADLVWELILKHGNSRKAVIKAAQGALESAGVEFTTENGGGAGVRIRKP
ncbi:transcriptional regulator [Mesorhizobium loti]|uniref:Transcriptional regulator n=1 Tax=Mesorhizobium jarvisii TaxID=1777867 RepID=A0A6M7TLX8_9HYPH|nr:MULTISPECIES: hypothetical protein [Mesorhizobium]AID30579.1 transcriptional regulator [Mesorhizobium huakuii 7653R]MCH4556618.1 transcriptional regulator [Mesorhizobium jarvisii]OBQ64248.1 hypothetical protein A9K72_17190 [Mesorhizobium loti]QKC64397.1 transcriptional regulator [Mesorhizobium jarvisii]QKD10311.1 transcriptional regulator [Mesorhizobium loti]